MVEALDEHMSCPICLEICTNAVETACCSQLLCENCAFGLQSCPVCRTEPLSVSINRSIRRVIGAMPIECKCGVRVTRADMQDHERTCPLKVTCAIPGCDFRDTRAAFIKHIVSKHSSELITYFTSPSPSPYRDCIAIIGPARIGTTGKYYCGQPLNDSCSCCNGICGVADGCNCESCMQHDLTSRALPKGYLVNREGRISKLNEENGLWYCGALVVRRMIFTRYYCEARENQQCKACKILQNQANTRYAELISRWRGVCI